jgi:hypothetical protein
VSRRRIGRRQPVWGWRSEELSTPVVCRTCLRPIALGLARTNGWGDWRHIACGSAVAVEPPPAAAEERRCRGCGSSAVADGSHCFECLEQLTAWAAATNARGVAS